MMRATHTYTTMGVSGAAFAEIYGKPKAAGYFEYLELDGEPAAFLPNIALVPEPQTPQAASECQDRHEALYTAAKAVVDYWESGGYAPGLEARLAQAVRGSGSAPRRSAAGLIEAARTALTNLTHYSIKPPLGPYKKDSRAEVRFFQWQEDFARHNEITGPAISALRDALCALTDAVPQDNPDAASYEREMIDVHSRWARRYVGEGLADEARRSAVQAYRAARHADPGLDDWAAQHEPKRHANLGAGGAKD